MSYNLRIIQEFFLRKIGRKIKIFSLGRKNNILIKKKSVLQLKSERSHRELGMHDQGYWDYAFLL